MNKNYYKTYRVINKYTFKYVSREIYNHQCGNSKQRGHKKPNYTLKEFRIWLKSQNNFNLIWGNWVKSNFEKWLKPSVDRIKDDLPYTFGNIQLVTWKYNFNKGNNSRKSPVLQFDLDGNFIKEYESATDAKNISGFCRTKISNCCNGHAKSHKGFIWKFKQNV